MLFSISLLTALVAWGVFGGIIVNRRFSHWSLPYRLLAVLLPAASALLALSWTGQVLRATDSDWNQARLAPLFGLRFGYSLYYPAETGPIMGAIYGPISYLAYFPSLLAHSPIPALLIGSATATLYYFAPVALIFMSGQFRRQEARAVGLFLLVVFGLWTVGNAPLRYSCFSIHADAPALGFGAAACALLMPANQRRQSILVVLSALFTVLAFFSKQSLVFLAPALLCFIWITDGKRSALQFAAGIAILSAVTFGIFSSLFSARALYFNMYAFPSQHSFGDAEYMHFPEGGVLAAAKTLKRVGQDLWNYSQWLVLGVAICYVVEIHASRPHKFAPREWLRQNRWAVFHFVALAGLPLAVIFGAKVGGDINAFSLHLYFALIGLLLFVGHLVLKYEALSRPVVAMCVILAATVIPTVPISLDLPQQVRSLRMSNTEQVYHYEKMHPGETYFSFFPLPVLMVEGRMDHFEYGVFDRELGLARVSPSHFLQYIPPHPKYIQKKKSSPVSEYLPQFSCETTQPGIANLKFYADCSASKAP